MAKIGILHVSDTHIDKRSIPDIDMLVDKLIKDISKVKIDNNVQIDLVCFTGDLINRGDKANEDEKQIELAEEHFVNPLLESLGLNKSDFIMVPGNHEVDISKIVKMTEKGLASLSSAKEISETIREMPQEYKSRIQYFNEYILNKFLPDAQIWNLGYSINRIVNGVNIGIVGLDSAWRSSGRGNTERGSIIVGVDQVNSLYSNIKDSDLKICLMHHPLDWLLNADMTDVSRKLGVFDIVLRGHVHDLDDKQICTKQNRTIYNTSGKLNPIDEYYSGYSVISIDTEIRKCFIYAREYLGKPREDFDKALRINENGFAEYPLNSFDSEKVFLYDIKQSLKTYYEQVNEKYMMLKNIDSFSPGKVRDFYVEPKLTNISDFERIKGGRTTKHFFLEQIARTSGNFLILGKRECGKTTALQRLGILFANDEMDRIPVYIDMRNLVKSKDRILATYRNFIFNNIPSEMSISREDINRILADGKIIFLIDNVNVSDASIITWIQSFTREYSNNRFIFTAEEKFYQTYSLKELPKFDIQYKTVYLEYFGKDQVREMVSKWGEGKESFDSNQMTQRIVSYCRNTRFALTPFNVAVFLTIWDVDRSFVPINEGKVMRTYLETILDKFSTEGVQRSEYDFDIKQHFLGYLSYKMFLKDEYFFSADEFDKVVDEYHTLKGFQKSKSNFDRLFFEKSILCVHGENVYFSNTSIMEYCLASYAIVDTDLYNQITSKGARIHFAHELSFYSGIVQDCTNLLESIGDEITATILDNMDSIDEIEGLSIGIEFNIEKNMLSDSIIKNRQSIKETDQFETNSLLVREISPLKMKKISTIDEKESFLDLLYIYGNAIKNAETADKRIKRIHFENYILGIILQFSLMIKESTAYFISATKEDLPDAIKEKYPHMTDKEFEKLKKDSLELMKTVLPIAIQFCISDNIGTPKLDLVIKDLIDSYKDKRFIRFMLSFLLCDLGCVDIKSFLSSYIRDEDSKDILKLILFKLTFYYKSWYFGNDKKKDEALISLISEVQYKLLGNKKVHNRRIDKERYKNYIEQELRKERI